MNKRGTFAFVLIGVLAAFAVQPVFSLDTPSKWSPMNRLQQMRTQGTKLRAAQVHSRVAAPPPGITIFEAPGSMLTLALGTNLGVGRAKKRIVGYYNLNDSTSFSGITNGFEFSLTTQGTKTTETFEIVGPQNSDFGLFGVNDSGDLVGYQGATTSPMGVILKGGLLTQLIPPVAGACDFLPLGINDSGTVVGEYQFNVNCNAADGWSERAVTWRNGVFTELPGYPGAGDSVLSGINSAGDIVGSADIPLAGGYSEIGFLLSSGQYTSIVYPGAIVTSAYGINDAGDVVGSYCIGTFADCNNGVAVTHGFLLSQGTYTTIDIPGEPVTYAQGINNAGEIVGAYLDAAGLFFGFISYPSQR